MVRYRDDTWHIHDNSRSSSCNMSVTDPWNMNGMEDCIRSHISTVWQDRLGENPELSVGSSTWVDKEKRLQSAIKKWNVFVPDMFQKKYLYSTY